MHGDKGMKQFLTISEAALEFSRSEKTIQRMVDEIRKYPDRYEPELNFFGSRGKLLVRAACLMDYDRNADLLERCPAIVPRYIPSRYEMSLGFQERYPTAKEIAREVYFMLRGTKNDTD